jgi:malonyl-CoA O-methyltransferase
MKIDRKTRIAEAFSLQAEAYDGAAEVQKLVADELARRIGELSSVPPQRILEIGCGTGILSQRLADAFPHSEFLLTDVSPSMLNRCRSRLGDHYGYQLVDGERPDKLPGSFDLIASSLAFQWFADLRGGLERLSRLLAPGGRMFFSTLGNQTFIEWRQVHAALGLPCGTPTYQSAKDLPWPGGLFCSVDEQHIIQQHTSGLHFVKSLKLLGAREPVPGFRPLPPGTFRRLLASVEDGISVTYHVLYGEISAPPLI